jgi:hypothetical protein
MRRGVAFALAAGGFWLLRKTAGGAPRPPLGSPPPDSSPLWKLARLSEYHPDAPPEAGKKVIRREGGPLDRRRAPAIMVQQHRADPAQYPYVSVSGDLIIEGRPVPYGARIYFASYPGLVFRLVDTGDNFRADVNKQIKTPGAEPFDIATAYKSSLGFAGTLTRYYIDFDDILPAPPRRTA